MPPPRPKTAVARPSGNILTPRLGPKSKIRITGSLEDIRRDNSTYLLFGAFVMWWRRTIISRGFGYFLITGISITTPRWSQLWTCDVNNRNKELLRILNLCFLKDVFVFLWFVAPATSDALKVGHIWSTQIASPRCSIWASGAILESLRGWHWHRLMWNVVGRHFGHDRPPLRWKY